IERYRAHPSRAALGFCVSIEHANRMASAFNAAGIPAAAVHSGEGSLDRAEAISSLAAGQLRVLFTVDLFNEGVDIPAVDLVLFLRPTESMTIFVQQLGRGLRVHRDKPVLTVLDFIGNYRNAHVKLSLLAGQEFNGASDRSTSASALTRIERWLEGGTRPDGVPEGVLLDIEPIALSTLRDSLRRAMPQREAVLQAMTALAGRKGRAPSLKEWVDESGFKLGTALKATGTDRWMSLLGLAALATDADRALDEQVGEFLKEIERTSMTRSLKMVVLEAMIAGDRFRDRIGLAALVSHFRERFAREAWRSDVAGTEVEAVDTVSDARWRAYLLRNPIAAWVGSAEKPGSFFRLDSTSDELCYVGPVPPEPLRDAFRRAIADRTDARLLDYWRRPGPGRFVFPVIPTGAEARQESRQRSFCIMFGNNREGLPVGWHVVRINDRTLYGKFVKVALNKVAETPHDDAANRLTAELTALFGGSVPTAARVRMVRDAGADVWRVERA
ncbi:MAG: helicase-related protein, partial [bacterium]